MKAPKFYVYCPTLDERYGEYATAERADKARREFDRLPFCTEPHEVEVVVPDPQEEAEIADEIARDRAAEEALDIAREDAWADRR